VDTIIAKKDAIFPISLNAFPHGLMEEDEKLSAVFTMNSTLWVNLSSISSVNVLDISPSLDKNSMGPR
jgi:hypothetical protein